MRVLVVTPIFALPPRGACEHDRVAGVRQLQRLGHEVSVFSFLAPYQDVNLPQQAERVLDCPVAFTPYELSESNDRVVTRLSSLVRRPAFLDGAALPYATEAATGRFESTLAGLRPDIVWFDYTNLWPLVERARRAGRSVVVRSLNYEPQHNLDERGATAVNYVRYFGKFLSERASIRGADAFAAITPADREHYLRLGRRDCRVLPLRALPSLIREPRQARLTTTLHVFFFGSNYAVSHNRTALRFILRDIAPLAESRAPGVFRFHVLGAKVPATLAAEAGHNVQIHGFVDDLDAALEAMDIALIPSLHGGGMQQKIFEPLCRAFPTVVSGRGLAGYPVRQGEHALLAHTADECLSALIRLRDPEERARLSAGAHALSVDQFNQPRLDAIVTDLLDQAAHGGGAPA